MSRPVTYLPLVIVLLIQGCNSPFQVKQAYSPQLVVYGIAFRGDTTLVVRVDKNSETSLNNSSVSAQISGLRGTLLNRTTGVSEPLTAEYVNNVNLLEGKMKMDSRTNLVLQVAANGYPSCSSSLAVLDSGIIYPAYFTTSVLRAPTSDQQDPKFTIYPSSLTLAIRLSILLDYEGFGPGGRPVSGEISVNPAYQQDTTSYFLRINGQITDVYFNLSDYSSAFAQAMGEIDSGKVVAVVKLLQVDAALYDFYSISNGFNDPLTMRTEKPVYTNITGGLGFFGSASYDSVAIRVYP